MSIYVLQRQTSEQVQSVLSQSQNTEIMTIQSDLFKLQSNVKRCQVDKEVRYFLRFMLNKRMMHYYVCSIKLHILNSYAEFRSRIEVNSTIFEAKPDRV